MYFTIKLKIQSIDSLTSFLSGNNSVSIFYDKKVKVHDVILDGFNFITVLKYSVLKSR